MVEHRTSCGLRLPGAIEAFRATSGFRYVHSSTRFCVLRPFHMRIFYATEHERKEVHAALGLLAAVPAYQQEDMM